MDAMVRFTAGDPDTILTYIEEDQSLAFLQQLLEINVKPNDEHFGIVELRYLTKDESARTFKDDYRNIRLGHNPVPFDYYIKVT